MFLSLLYSYVFPPNFKTLESVDLFLKRYFVFTNFFPNNLSLFYKILKSSQNKHGGLSRQYSETLSAFVTISLFLSGITFCPCKAETPLYPQCRLRRPLFYVELRVHFLSAQLSLWGFSTLIRLVSYSREYLTYLKPEEFFIHIFNCGPLT